MESHLGSQQAERYPMGIPNSWYLVAYSSDVNRGELKHLTYFGEEQILFRGEDGCIGLIGAYCDHLGAHLAFGGKVVGNCVQCPFHKWQWNYEGRCAAIPYATIIPANARLRHYPVREHSGVILAWYHRDAREPTYEVPPLLEYGDPAWTKDWIRYEWRVRTHPQELHENAVDWPHFLTVHGFDAPANVVDRYEAHEFIWGATVERDSTCVEGNRETVRQESRMMGLGCTYLRLTGDLDSLAIVGTTPFRTDETHMRMAVIGNRAKADDAAIKAYADQQAKAMTDDFEIWEHKQYKTQPKLCHRDGPIERVREWARQFYV
jgi:phenylpropionate dioxygenase-like ring-hydroxylating dioxygenase large terminal subunit